MGITCRTRDCFQVMGEPDWGSEMTLHPNMAHFPTVTSRSPLGLCLETPAGSKQRPVPATSLGDRGLLPCPRFHLSLLNPRAQLSRIKRNLQHQGGESDSNKFIKYPPKYEHKQVKKNTHVTSDPELTKQRQMKHKNGKDLWREDRMECCKYEGQTLGGLG